MGFLKGHFESAGRAFKLFPENFKTSLEKENCCAYLCGRFCKEDFKIKFGFRKSGKFKKKF